jgi:hypothetical protein
MVLKRPEKHSKNFSTYPVARNRFLGVSINREKKIKKHSNFYHPVIRRVPAYSWRVQRNTSGNHRRFTRSGLGLRCFIYWFMSLTLAGSTLHLNMSWPGGRFDFNVHVQYQDNSRNAPRNHKTATGGSETGLWHLGLGQRAG